ncbi:MAG: hypothetical protein HKN47_27735 [Pirellulaceae bacterium]|nr:hypothetical protein [Pirellulaceae bacterium]
MRTLSWILIIAVCFVSGGATCMRRDVPMPFAPPPVVLNETPSITDVAAAVNRTSQIRQLSTNSASVDVLSMPKLPKLSATLSLQRERRFRLRASLPIVLGSGLDMGSNEQLFWFEVPEGISKTLYFAQHEQYRQQLNRAILPVDPTWIMDALGLVQIDPATVVAGPVRRSDGRLEVRNAMSLPNGTYQRVCLIDAQAGFVTHQFLYAPNGSLVANSEASNHRYYEEYDCALPHSVKINLQPASGPPLAMQIDVGNYALNQLLSGDPQLFVMPQSASKAVDLTQIGGGPTSGAAAGGVSAIPSSAGTATIAPSHYTTGRLGPMPLRGTVRGAARAIVR